jgi:predicted dehydrogenase
MEGDITVNYNATWAARDKPTSWDGDITITGEQGCLVLVAANQVRCFAEGDSPGDLLKNVEMKRSELDHALDLFIRCLDGDEIPETTLEDNLNSFAMVGAAEESAQSAAPVQLTRSEVE